MNCKTCWYFDEYETHHPRKKGVCRKYPPVVIPFGGGEGGGTTQWPEVDAEDSCGEYKRACPDD